MFNKKHWKRTSAIALTAALALSLSACGGGGAKNDAAANEPAGNGATSGSGGEKITITFQNIYPDPATPSYKTIHALVEEYEAAHPNIHIELDTLNTDQQKIKLKTQAASKEVPDITIVNPAAQMKPFVDAGLLAPLNDMLDQNGLKDTYQEGLLDYYSFDGNVYALPDGNNIEVVYYNKELFEQAGITKVPETFDEFLADVKIFKEKGITPLAIGEKDS